ncbi:PspC domain-containing protein [Flavobacterium sp.]|jgi:phage shock protein PspC (stress-responsive transcriptional regulator)|uniref:PspC domain-containing protein n=1 Tax=Flavobacterium sp. TaxID=239 RepID=UPI002A7F47FC|nr:PspC domain-containing protein [Flavobacterium sp.]
MNKTISINLGGYFFHIDEDAYQKLTRYFDAVKRSLSYEGRDEIVKDIESRIAELFQERLQNEKQVVGIKEIDEVISIMGQPEDYKIDEDTSSNFNSDYSNTRSYSNTRKLYRDKDNSMLGGVLSGLGHYLGIDPLWLRIIMVILFFGFGTGLLIYIILWILVPEAITNNQKLEMKGEPINISNIEKKVKEGFDDITGKINNLDHQKIANTAKSGANQVVSTVGDLFLSIFKAFAKIIGAFMMFFSSMALLGIIIASIVMIFSSSLSDKMKFNFMDTPFDSDVPFWLQGILLLFTVGIPFLFLIILGLKLLLNNMKPMASYVKYGLIAIWVIALSATIYLGIQQANQVGFEGKVIQKEYLNIQPTDTLFIKMEINDFYSKNVNRRRNAEYTHDEQNNEIIYSTNVRLHLMRTDKDVPYFQVEKTADGKSINEAKNRAEKIKYHFEVQGNKIILDNYLTTEFKNKYRDQEVHIYLYLPNGFVIFPDESISDYLTSNNSDIGKYYGHEGFFYKVNGSEMDCLNCSEEENNEIEINEDVNSDASTTLYYDENGVLVKKVINSKKAIDEIKDEIKSEIKKVKIEIN